MDTKFDDIFKLSAVALKLNLGYPYLPLTLKWAAQIFVRYLGFLPTFLSLIYSSIYFDGFTKICSNLGLAVVFFVITINYSLLTIFKKTFCDMIRITEENLNCFKKHSEDEIVIRDYVDKGKSVAKAWLLICAVSGGVFPCKAIAGTLYYTLTTGNVTFVPMYEVTYPSYIEERKETVEMYLIIFAFQLFYVIFTSLMYVGFNPLGPIFITQACGQIELVMRQTDRLFAEKNIDIDDALKNLNNIMRQIQDIYNFVNQIQQTHRVMYETCLITSTIIIPVSCIGVVESYSRGKIEIELIFYICAAILQCYIPCYFSEMLSTKGEQLRVAIYGCGWERHWLPRSRSTILLMLTRTAHPLGIHAVFCTVRMEAFANVLTSSYRIFSVMNAAWN
uniref:Odorant receptor n=1 Tax=Lobesia botrana TaxID=209534 RepID=A0A345BEW4_9NEOP|nr:odorant receptors OR41 [Lobesia botrana]